MTGTICTASRPECLTGGSEYPSTCPKVCWTQSHHMTPKSFVFFQSWTCISHILWLLVYCPGLLFISSSMLAFLLPWALIYLIIYGYLSIALGKEEGTGKERGRNGGRGRGSLIPGPYFHFDFCLDLLVWKLEQGVRLGEGEGGDCVLLNDVVYQSVCVFQSTQLCMYVCMCMLQCTTSLLCGTK